MLRLNEFGDSNVFNTIIHQFQGFFVQEDIQILCNVKPFDQWVLIMDAGMPTLFNALLRSVMQRQHSTANPK